jgi:trehalose 6-phosphate synthase/phosphatase
MRIFIVSNRLPISVSTEKNNPEYKQGSGGLATAIQSLITKEEDSEIISVGWPGDVEKKLQQQIKNDLYNQFNAIPIFLTKKQLNNFYYGYSNKTLWPMLHGLTDKVKQSQEYWQEYQAVNNVYFSEIAAKLKADDIVWIHDYHLMLLPGLIKSAFPSVSVGYFHHTPIPEFPIFNHLPDEQIKIIFENLTMADVIGFHTQKYKENFLDILSKIQELSRSSEQYKIIERKTDVFPISIDFDKYYSSSLKPEVKREIKKFKKIKKNAKLILSLDRLDYTKNIPIRVQAVRELLQEHPELAEKIVLVIVAEPSRTAIEEYQKLKVEIEEEVKKTNLQFSSKEWTPIIYINEQLNFNNVAALYHLADINLVTPYSDGMNLVAKEYIAAKQQHPGLLILSKYAGAAEELSEALLIDPENIEQIKKAIRIAIDMPIEIQKMRNMVMQEQIKYNDIVHWGTKFLNDLTLKGKETK